MSNAPLSATACTHCGSPMPGTARDDNAPQFCCTGCSIVYQAIRDNGLSRYYDLAASPAPAKLATSAYQEFDDPTFHAHHVKPVRGGASVSLYVEDMRCAGCMWLVEATPQCLAGVRNVRVDFARAKADVEFDPSVISLSAIAQHLGRLGHPVHAFRALESDARRKREDRKMMVRMGVAGAAFGNLMLLAVALYAGVFADMASRDLTIFRWASMLVALPALSFAAAPFFAAGVSSLRSGRLHLDLPLAIGIAAGLIWGSINVLRGVGEIYFDSLAMLVFLLLVSRWLVGRQQRKALLASEVLSTLVPRTAHRLASLASTDAVDIPLEGIGKNDYLLVRPGETIPVDGAVALGDSSLDLSMLSGESVPKRVQVGDGVNAGTINLSSPLVITARAVGEETRIGQLAAHVAEMSRRKAPIEKLVDAMAGRFVVTVLSIAVLTIAFWSWRSSFTTGMEHAMALLIVTCPCALALATPLAVSVALGRAAKHGILIKGPDAIERLSQRGTVYLDKTGTITEGKWCVSHYLGADAHRAAIAAVERGSAHPLAKAIVETLGDPLGVVASDIQETFGRGIRGRVGDDEWWLGSPAWLGETATVSDGFDAVGALATIRENGATPVFVAKNGALCAAIGLSDAVRPETRAAIERLQTMGWRVQLLSGDDPSVVTAVGQRLGLDQTLGGVTPEQKLAVITDSVANGPTVMVGDGINDAAALSAASCGIAVSGSVEASLDAADVFLSKPGIAGVALTLDGASRTLATIRRNFKISLFYNVVAGLLAVTGLIHPIIAALMMPLSSGSVLLSSMVSSAFRRFQ